jgi:hypothetical protein
MNDADSTLPGDSPSTPRLTESEELAALFHRLWSRASTGDQTYVKAEWKRLAELLARRGIQT